MSISFVRLICRILVVCVIGLPLHVQAGLIGTDQAIAAAPSHVARDTAPRVLNRAEMAYQLQWFGLTPQDARDRVDALSDGEVAQLAGQIQNLPAGAVQPLAILAVVVIFYWFFVRK